jgi:drug/metabolite transporter (DMT)-like permease
LLLLLVLRLLEPDSRLGRSDDVLPMAALGCLGVADLDWPAVHVGAWAAVGFSAVFATAYTFAAWQRGISRIGANRVLVYQYLITLTGVVSGIVFFGERLGAGKILGGAVILLGVYLARRR